MVHHRIQIGVCINDICDQLIVRSVRITHCSHSLCKMLVDIAKTKKVFNVGHFYTSKAMPTFLPTHLGIVRYGIAVEYGLASMCIDRSLGTETIGCIANRTIGVLY